MIDSPMSIFEEQGFCLSTVTRCFPFNVMALSGLVSTSRVWNVFATAVSIFRFFTTGSEIVSKKVNCNRANVY